MKRLAIILSTVFLTLYGLLAMAEDRETTPRIENIRFGVDAKGQTRIVFDLDDRPAFDVWPAAGAGDGSGPALVVKIAGASDALSGTALKPRGVVETVSVEGEQVELRLTTEVLPVTSFVLEPTESNGHYRLVIDVVTAPQHDFAAAIEKAKDRAEEKESTASEALTEPREDETSQDGAPSAEDLAAALELPKELTAIAETRPAPAPSLNPARMMDVAQGQADKDYVIVLDPGHGGRDPGAQGATGVMEKDITLDTAKLLKSELERMGYKVLMTRSDDSFIPLVGRIEYARERRADLFLSIHADSNVEPLARGATVYTLSDERSDAMAQATTSTGNFVVFDVEAGADTAVGTDVGSILFDLANEDTRRESVKLAETMIGALKGRIPMVRNTHRRRSLQVLLSPDVPAVLVELAFLSNAKDEANLTSKEWRRRTAGLIAVGVDNYFTANQQSGSLAGYNVGELVNP